MIVPLLALALLQGDPAITFPKAATDTGLPADVRAWEGFRYAGGERSDAKPFRAPGDWSAIAGADATSGAPMKVKIFLALRTEERLGANGGAVLRRGTLEENDQARAIAAILRLPKLVAAATGGRVKLAVDISTEEETLTELRPGGGLGAAIEAYVRPRVNEGTYVDEDNEDRGPYHAILVVAPTAGVTYPVTPADPEDAPLAIVGYGDGGPAEGGLEERLLAGFLSAVATRARLQGLRSDGSTVDGWPILADLSPPLAGAFNARLAAGAAFAPKSSVAVPFVATAREGEYALAFSDDPAKGRVLEVVEKGYFRGGGVALPNSGAVTARSLRIDLKSDAPYPVAVGFVGADGGRSWVALGTDGEGTSPASPAVPFRYDGAWQTVRVPVPAGTKAIFLGPTPRMISAERRARGPIVVTLASVATDLADASASVVPPVTYVPAATSGEGLRKALASEDFRVRLNASIRYGAAKDPVALPLLASAASDLEPAVGVAAVEALAFQKTPEATEAIRRVIKSGAPDRVKAAAALALVGLDPDPKTILTLQPVFANRAWRTRLAAVVAASRYDTQEAGIFRMAMIGQSDPQIKLTVTEHADPNRDFEARKLLYSVVNEPWDGVRYASAVRLLGAKDESFVEEALKAVRDDSVGVRRRFARYLATHPDPRWRSAFRVAVADKDPYVRGYALDGFAAIGKADPAEVKGAWSDGHPVVQRALAALALKVGLSLPEDTRRAMRESPDPAVVAAERLLPSRS